MVWLLALIFWLSALAVFWAYIGYPLFISLLARWRPRPHRRADLQLPVSIIVPAYNEEAVIAESWITCWSWTIPSRGASCWSWQMAVPTARWRSSNCTRHGVSACFSCRERRGKMAAMNRGVAAAQGEILVFSDANAMMERSSLQAMVRNFADPCVACVSGVKKIRPICPCRPRASRPTGAMKRA